jgi:V/A-type H+-transporting ATPase subunit A
VYYRRGADVIKRGITLVKLKQISVYQDIIKMKFNVPNEDLKLLDKLMAKLERAMDQLESVYV